MSNISGISQPIFSSYGVRVRQFSLEDFGRTHQFSPFLNRIFSSQNVNIRRTTSKEFISWLVEKRNKSSARVDIIYARRPKTSKQNTASFPKKLL